TYDPKHKSVSFCGCGFILGYELGVIQALQELAPEILGSAAKFFGISSGAIAAAVLACGGNQGKVDEWFSLFGVFKKSLFGPYSPRFHFLKLLEKGLRKGLTENCHQLASGRLHIGLTRLPDGQKVVISDFCSKEEVIQAVLCSCFIPVIWGWIPPSFRGVRYIDGGFTSLHPLSDPETTIYVSPFAGENDICPRDCPAAFYSIKVLDCSFQISVENLCRISYGIFPPLCLVSSRRDRAVSGATSHSSRSSAQFTPAQELPQKNVPYLLDHRVQPPALGRNECWGQMTPARYLSNLLLNTSKEGDSTTSLGAYSIFWQPSL
uniref:Patatin-like phospholipase domain-containing protein 1 n=1 Tax=Crocodylus porosus TaxID=8502 RepID=A0A7M4E5C8_CROPO